MDIAISVIYFVAVGMHLVFYKMGVSCVNR